MVGMDNPPSKEIDPQNLREAVIELQTYCMKQASKKSDAIELINDKKGERIIKLKTPFAGFNYITTISPSGNYVFTLRRSIADYHNNDFEVFDASKGELLHGGLTIFQTSQFSSDDRYLAINKETSVDILESQTGKLVQTITPQFPMISTDLTFLPGNLVAYPDVASLIPSDDFQNTRCAPTGFVTIFIDLLRKEVLGSIPGRKFEYCESGRIKFERNVIIKGKQAKPWICEELHSKSCTRCLTIQTERKTGYSYYNLPSLKPLTLPDQSLGLKEEVQLPAPLSRINDNRSVQIALLKALGNQAKK
jgi:hypothetical protein